MCIYSSEVLNYSVHILNWSVHMVNWSVHMLYCRSAYAQLKCAHALLECAHAQLKACTYSTVVCACWTVVCIRSTEAYTCLTEDVHILNWSVRRHKWRCASHIYNRPLSVMKNIPPLKNSDHKKKQIATDHLKNHWLEFQAVQKWQRATSKWQGSSSTCNMHLIFVQIFPIFVIPSMMENPHTIKTLARIPSSSEMATRKFNIAKHKFNVQHALNFEKIWLVGVRNGCAKRGNVQCAIVELQVKMLKLTVTSVSQCT